MSHLEVPAVFPVQGLEETLGAGHWCPHLLPQSAKKGVIKALWQQGGGLASLLQKQQLLLPGTFLPTHQ